VDRLLGEHGLGADTEASRQIFAERMETRRRGELEAGGKYQRGWGIGDKPFKEKLLLRIAGQLGEHHPGTLRMAAAAAQAEAMVLKELTRLGWTAADLTQRRKGDAQKLALAVRLRAQTTVSIRWIAGRLSMGSWKSLTSRLQEWRKAQEDVNVRD